MSVTMLLRRSPELDVATLGQMNLISSKTLRLSATPPSRCGSPDHVVSNTTHPVHKEVVSTRPVPKGRNAIVPHVVHLRDLQNLNLGGNADVSAEFEGVRRTMRGGQAWDLTQYGNANGHSTAKHAQHRLTQRAQHGVGDAAVSATFRTTQSKVADAQPSNHAFVTGMSDTAADDETFDLYHLSQTLKMQPLAGLREMQSSSRCESPNGARALPQGSCSMQSPALDSYEAEAAAVGAAESPGSFSIQPPALDSPLSRKASSVRFTMDRAFTPDPGTDDDSSQRAGASPELMQTANSPSVDDRGMSIDLEETPSSSSSSPAGTIAGSAVNRTISCASYTSSLKSALKQSVSNASSTAAALSRGNSTLKGSVSGVSFALDGGDNIADKEAELAQDDALTKQASGSFPSWLTDG